MITDPDGKPYAHNAEQSEAAKRGRMIENARAHHAQLKDANARAERAEAELTAAKERLRSEAMDDYASIKNLQRELATEREKVRVLRSALENLCDEQNGPPLEVNRGQWQLAMDESRLALVVTEGAK